MQSSPHQPSSVIANSTAPKKKFLERTISQTDAEKQKQELAFELEKNRQLSSFFLITTIISRSMQELHFSRQDLVDKVRNFFEKHIFYF